MAAFYPRTVLQLHSLVNRMCPRFATVALVHQPWTRMRCTKMSVLTVNHLQCLHTSLHLDKNTDFKSSSQGIKKSQKTVKIIGNNLENLGEMTLKNAEDMATDKNLKLVLIDRTTHTPVYQLMTGKQLLEEKKKLQQLKKTLKKKDMKTVRLTTKVSDHDLDTKMKNAKTWLVKGHEVKVWVKKGRSTEESKMASKIMQKVAEATKELGQMDEVKDSAQELIFQVAPLENEPQIMPDVPPPLTMQEIKMLRKEELLKREKKDDSQ